MQSPLVRKISTLLPISDEERAAVEALEQGGTPLPAQTRFIVEGAPDNRGIGIVQAGWVLRSKTLPDGRRQVINVSLPGDVLCLDALAIDHAYYDLWTVGRAIVTQRSIEEIEKLQADFPRLAMAFRRFAVLEDAMLCERLLSVGRRSAIEAVSHLLLELWCRLKIAGLADARGFPLPLSQEIIGDALGLSTVHVNRTLKALQNGHFIDVDRDRPRSITVRDPSRLERLAGFRSDYLRLAGMVVEIQRSRSGESAGRNALPVGGPA
jgi:CRP-like cAMP-binding protein